LTEVDSEIFSRLIVGTTQGDDGKNVRESLIRGQHGSVRWLHRGTGFYVKLPSIPDSNVIRPEQDNTFSDFWCLRNNCVLNLAFGLYILEKQSLCVKDERFILVAPIQ